MGSPKVSQPVGEARLRIDVNQCMASLKKAGKKCLKVYGYSGEAENAAKAEDCYQLAIEYPSGMIENFRRAFPFIETPAYLLIQATKNKKCENKECLPHLQFYLYEILLGENPTLKGYISHKTSGELVDLVSRSRLIENSLVLNPTDPSDEQLLNGALKHVIGDICPHIMDWKAVPNYTPRPEAMKHPEVRGTYEDYLKQRREEE